MVTIVKRYNTKTPEDTTQDPNVPHFCTTDTHSVFCWQYSSLSAFNSSISALFWFSKTATRFSKHFIYSFFFLRHSRAASRFLSNLISRFRAWSSPPPWFMLPVCATTETSVFCWSLMNGENWKNYRAQRTPDRGNTGQLLLLRSHWS